jgi:hypothetical protein
MDTKKLEELVNEYVKTREEVTLALIHGSYALNESTPTSDIDLLLVTKDAEEMQTCHEILNGKSIEVTIIGAKMFNEMVKETNPFIFGALQHGIPIYGRETIETVKKSLDDKVLEKWSQKYYARGMERLKEAEKDTNEATAAVTLILNAYLLSKKDTRLSYSLEKLVKRIKDNNVRNLLNGFLKAKEGAQSLEYAQKIAETLRQRVLG